MFLRFVVVNQNHKHMKSGTKLNDEQRLIVLEVIEEIGLENLCLCITKLALHADCASFESEKRDDLYRFIHGLFLISHQ